MRLENGVTVEVVTSLEPVSEVVYPYVMNVTPVYVPIQGPPGPPGPAGGPQGPPGEQGLRGPQGKTGSIQWHGQGPPGVIVGAEPNDLYLDESTGLIYKLT